MQYFFKLIISREEESLMFLLTFELIINMLQIKFISFRMQYKALLL